MRGCRPSATSPHRMPPLSARQGAKAFNQPLLGWDTSSVTNFEVIFEVHSACALRPDSSRAFPCTLHHTRPPLHLPPRLPPPLRTSYPPLLLTRQEANSLSDANKLLIRCAWAGNAAFDSEYDSTWGPGSCT